MQSGICRQSERSVKERLPEVAGGALDDCRGRLCVGGCSRLCKACRIKAVSRAGGFRVGTLSTNHQR